MCIVSVINESGEYILRNFTENKGFLKNTNFILYNVTPYDTIILVNIMII